MKYLETILIFFLEYLEDSFFKDLSTYFVKTDGFKFGNMQLSALLFGDRDHYSIVSF